MKNGIWSAMMMMMMMMMISVLGSGCGERNTAPVSAEKTSDIHDAADHSGWWCNEHGVPEEVCGLCDSKLAAEFQKKGDWCKTHDRPESQCFVCHPEHEARFAAQYEAKFGTKPSKPQS